MTPLHEGEANLTSRFQELEQAPPVEDPKDEKEGGAGEDTDLSLLVIIAFILGLIGILLGTAAMYKARKSSANDSSVGDTGDSEEPPDTPPAQELSSGEAPSAPVGENEGVNTYQITNSSGPTSGGGQPASAQPAVLAGESPAPAAIPPAPPPV
jgi:hypothetical protein